MLGGGVATLLAIGGAESAHARSRLSAAEVDRVPPEFHRALAQTLLLLSKLFDAFPDFYYMDDGNAPNAVYLNPVGFPSARADGTVEFGRTYLYNIFRQFEHPEVVVAATCAHEWGHCVQWKRNLRGRLMAGSRTVKPMELHADYLAGYFTGVRRLQRDRYPAAVVAQETSNTGDYSFSSSTHHGTPRERGDAVQEGFLAGFKLKLTFDDALERGIAFARARL